MSKEYWNEEYWKKHLKSHEGEKLDFLEDIWINKYPEIFEKIPKGKSLDLGCGLGQYTKYMMDNGFKVTSVDISEEVLNRLKENIPEANTMQLDMSQKLPFKDNEFNLVIANLSIHYFDEKTTKKLLSEIKRILRPGGYFIGSVNSSKSFKYIADVAQKIEDNFFYENGRMVRLWDKEQFNTFFSEFEELELEEVTTIRWNREKIMWEFIYKV